MRSILAGLSPRERDALDRFYNREQDVRTISTAVGMTESELRELRKRVKKAFQKPDLPL
jgi:hypothetical protein